MFLVLDVHRREVAGQLLVAPAVDHRLKDVLVRSQQRLANSGAANNGEGTSVSALRLNYVMAAIPQLLVGGGKQSQKSIFS